MVSDILVSISLGNSLMPFRCQAITWTNSDLLQIRQQGTWFQWNVIKDSKDYMQQNILENVGKLLGWLQWAEMIRGLRPANERRRYNVTPYLIGRAQA